VAVAGVTVVGVDAGGTSTRSVAVTVLDGQVTLLGTGRGGAANYATVGHEAATAAVRDALSDALAAVPDRHVDAVVVGTAGRPAPAGQAVGELFAGTPSVVCDDLAVAFAAGTWHRDGAVAVAGTGSMAARVLDGQLANCIHCRQEVLSLGITATLTVLVR